MNIGKTHNTSLATVNTQIVGTCFSNCNASFKCVLYLLITMQQFFDNGATTLYTMY
ncbi:hypothetical protein APHNYW_0546 [Anaplasma phagocytophilum str. ApNYW]|nr:hypothetical protein APHNYW_0546 [Anaplasma phagocytophilum str. ApNYW]